MRRWSTRRSPSWAASTSYVHCPSGGFEPRGPADAIDEQLWDAALDSTAKGFLFAAQAAHRQMAARAAA